jgi:hypothetical protein
MSNVILRTCSCNNSFREKQICIIYSEFVCSINYLVRMSMRGITLSSVVCMVLSYIFTLSHKWHDFLTKGSLNMKCVSIFSTTLCETFLLL